MELKQLQDFYSRPSEEILKDGAIKEYHAELLRALEAGTLRCAQKNSSGTWEANAWVKSAILIGFRFAPIVPYTAWPGGAHDKESYPPRNMTLESKVRVVPGGSSIRSGAFVAPGVVVMPPAYINVGAFVDEASMVDSHALVGSCAQIGKGVHLSASVQIGGVLEPSGARPVVIEDGAFVGALSGVFEGVVVRERAVIAPGVILSASTTIYDLTTGKEFRGEVPAGAVVVAGSRPAKADYAHQNRINLYIPVIVKYRDEKTNAATVLEEALR